MFFDRISGLLQVLAFSAGKVCFRIGPWVTRGSERPAKFEFLSYIGQYTLFLAKNRCFRGIQGFKGIFLVIFRKNRFSRDSGNFKKTFFFEENICIGGPKSRF